METLLQWDLKEPVKTGNWEIDIENHQKFLDTWRAKKFTGKDARIEIKKFFSSRAKGEPYSANMLITIKTVSNEPRVIVSLNRKLALSMSELETISKVIKEALNHEQTNHRSLVEKMPTR